MLSQATGLPENIRAYITAFDLELSEEEFNDPRFSYRVFFVPKTANRKGQADQVIEFIKPGSEMAEGINTKYIQIKETERPKHLPSNIVEYAKQKGFAKFHVGHHTNLWKSLDAKAAGKGFGVAVGKAWYWYDSWVDKVLEHCEKSGADYR
ncbi:hypothetical protein [Pseudomonas viridiflava]|uniref:hypothetical protein n=1 Tax=Pseudomonas viridiflava TaxID=33069 RepID=UPI001F120BB2|nr:hypothetical protein [Pseudomonas viridiflava]